MRYIPTLTKHNADLIKNAIYIGEKFSSAVDETNKKSPAFHFSKIKKIVLCS